MGIETGTALLLAAGASAGVAMHQTQQAKKNKSKAPTITGAEDKLKVTPKGIAKKGARAALVVGSSRGVLSTEDQTATSGRGTLLGN